MKHKKRNKQRRLRIETLEGRMLMDGTADFFEVHQNSRSHLLDVLQNDVFPDLPVEQRHITSTSYGSKGGVVRVTEDGLALRYDPPADGTGTETFTYFVNYEHSSKVTISILAPLENDTVTVHPDATTAKLDVMANDPFWDGYDGAKKITLVSETRLGGTVSIGADGKSILYTPPEFKLGQDAFVYIVDHQYPAEVLVDVVDPLDSDRYSNLIWNTEDNVLNVLANDPFWVGYAGEKQITHLVVSKGTKGDFSIAEGGAAILYTPAEGFDGTEQIRYVVDGRYEQTVSVSLHRPVVDDFYGGGNYEQGVLSYLADQVDVFLPVLRNDPITWNDYNRVRSLDVVEMITSVDPSDAGSKLEITSDGQGILYTPPEGFRGIDTFQYTVDGSHIALVTVDVQEGSEDEDDEGEPGDTERPTVPSDFCNAVSDAFVANQNSSNNVIDVVANDFRNSFCSLPEGSRDISEVSNPSNGTVVIADDGKTLSYTPDADFVGSDVFTYTVDDTWVGTVAINVVRRVRDDLYRVDPEGESQLKVLSNDLFGADYIGAQRISDVSSSEQGASVTINATRDAIDYIAPAGFTGQDRFTYTVDGGLKAEVTVHVISSRNALLQRYDSETLFGSVLEESLSRWSNLFGKTPEEYSRNSCLLGVCSSMAPTSSQLSSVHVASETNVQVQGIDEADLVENDGEFLYVLRRGELVITRAWPSDELVVVSKMAIENAPIGMYLNGGRLTIVSQANDRFLQPLYGFTDANQAYNSYFRNQITEVTVLDVSDRTSPEIVQKTRLDGSYVESRRIDDHVFLVMQHPSLKLPHPQLICETSQPEQETETVGNLELLKERTSVGTTKTCTYESQSDYVSRISKNFDAILPHYASFDANENLIRTGVMVAPDDIYKPLDRTVRNLISVISIDMSTNEPGLSGSTGILASGISEVYGAADGLYVLDHGYNQEDGAITRISKFDWNADTGLVDVASFGKVSGYLLNSFSVDSHDGYLRIATTHLNHYSGNHSRNADNALFVLQDNGGVMEVVGDLQNLGFNKLIKSVRFVEDRAFVTTYRQTDPFFVIDVSRPDDPVPVGHVTLPGFSSYMQMIDENHVLTIGRNTVRGFVGATQVLLFDVTDVTQPRLVGQHSFERGSYSIAERDHHAFGWFAPHEVLAIPLNKTSLTRVDRDEDGYRESWDWLRINQLALLEIDVTATVESLEGIRLRDEVTSDSKVLRAAYIDDVLYAIAEDSITAFDIEHSEKVIASVRTDSNDNTIQPIANIIDQPPWSMRRLADEARQEVVDQLGKEIGPPWLLSIEVLPENSKTENAEPAFFFGIGDEVVRVQSDAQGSLAIVDDQVQFLQQQDYKWRNPSLAVDVNNDSLVTPLDALLVINSINRSGSRQLPNKSGVRQFAFAIEPDSQFFDVTGDGWVTPLDVLRVINQLNDQDLDNRAGSNTLADISTPAVVGVFQDGASHGDRYSLLKSTVRREPRETIHQSFDEVVQNEAVDDWEAQNASLLNDREPPNHPNSPKPLETELLANNVDSAIEDFDFVEIGF